MSLKQRDLKLVSEAARGWFGGLAGILVLIVASGILTTFSDYFPPNFQKGFLSGRNTYFWRSPYAYGFYLHIVGAPVALLCGLPQFSRILLRTSPRVHRFLGKTYALTVLLAAAPGGFIMAFFSRGGSAAAACFVLMSILAVWFTALAWRAALQHRFEAHRKWMARSYLLVISAVVLRLLDPALRRAGVPDELSYQVSVWLSWVPSLLCFEVSESLSKRMKWN